jgi:hypothetical protein
VTYDPLRWMLPEIRSETGAIGGAPLRFGFCANGSALGSGSICRVSPERGLHTGNRRLSQGRNHCSWGGRQRATFAPRCSKWARTTGSNNLKQSSVPLGIGPTHPHCPHYTVALSSCPRVQSFLSHPAGESRCAEVAAFRWQPQAGSHIPSPELSVAWCPIGPSLVQAFDTCSTPRFSMTESAVQAYPLLPPEKVPCGMGHGAGRSPGRVALKQLCFDCNVRPAGVTPQPRPIRRRCRLFCCRHAGVPRVSACRPSQSCRAYPTP